MNEIVIVKPEKCVGCNACVRACPAPEANKIRLLENGKYISAVNPDKCIGCGTCVKTCRHGARDFLDDTDTCIAAMGKEKVIILASPAIKTILPTKWKNVLDWFKDQGCTVLDVSLGADICTWAHLRTINDSNVGNLVTQQCPAVVKYIETYQPKLVQNLSPIQSPAACTAIYVKKYLRRTNPIAVLSPCIAMKHEALSTELIDYSITIQKLMEYFDRLGISIPADTDDGFEYPFDDLQGQLGSIYSRAGGLRDNLWANDPDLNISSSDGVRRVFPELDLYAKMSENKHPEVFEVYACEQGCNMGPASGAKLTTFDVMTTMRQIEIDAKSRRKSTGVMGRGEDRLFKKFDDELRVVDFLRNYKPTMPAPMPSSTQLNPIFEKMGKTTDAERTYDCHACGYKSCRDMATAIFRGLNVPENCIIHAQSVLSSRQAVLDEQSEKLSEVTTQCRALSEKLTQNIDKISESMNTIGDSTTATGERAGVVKDLLQNIVAFCNANPTMDIDSVSQLTSILQTTIDAFGALDDNVLRTKESSEIIHDSVDDLMNLTAEIKTALDKASEDPEW